ncbi:heavy-metal-associated domain-containing protein [Streptomyces sp. NPDC001568]|uniref:heavy-metal-associated domain-containing protein n=1 Tax=Streptomyces sp. NPDC001568 TaxID=3364588 RepID=UPI0036C6E170
MTAETDTPQSSGSCCSSTGSCHDGTVEVGSGAVTAVYKVTGMTCGHCEGAVTAELTALPGVTSVKAVAATGEVTVISGAPLADEDVRAAVDEAGYELAGRA